MLDLIKVIILGIVEGITEFLPDFLNRSSDRRHSAAAAEFSAAMSKTFEIFIQIGAIVAVVAFYRVDIWRQVNTVRTDRRVQHFWIAMLIAFLPVAAIGFLLRDFIDQYLQDSPAVVAAALIVGGILFIIIERYLGSRANGTAEAGETATDADKTTALYAVSYRQALLIGIVQIAALIPGVSRSAASIFGGMLTGLNRETATRFSFYLAIPTLGAATVV